MENNPRTWNKMGLPIHRFLFKTVYEACRNTKRLLISNCTRNNARKQVARKHASVAGSQLESSLDLTPRRIQRPHVGALEPHATTYERATGASLVLASLVITATCWSQLVQVGCQPLALMQQVTIHAVQRQAGAPILVQ